MNPATAGPIAGPANGARVKNATAGPRLFASQTSEMIALNDGTINKGPAFLFWRDG